MRQGRPEKLEARLRAAEMRLRESLLRVLPQAAATGHGAFENSHFVSAKPGHGRLSQTAEQLLELALEALDLREEQGLAESGVGHLYLAARAENVSTNGHRRGPRRLAEWLLGEVRHVAQQAIQGDGPAFGGSAP